jgi:hypothetical protein
MSEEVKPGNAGDLDLDPDVGVSPLNIRLMFRHPDIDPAVITRELGVQPTLQRRVGEPIVGVDGKLRSPIHLSPESTWSLVKKYSSGSKLNECVNDIVGILRNHPSFVRNLSSQRYGAAIIISLPGQFYFGGSIKADLQRDIAELGLDLGIEVFPESAT